jgi:hypothetical protein
VVGLADPAGLALALTSLSSRKSIRRPSSTWRNAVSNSAGFTQPSRRRSGVTDFNDLAFEVGQLQTPGREAVSKSINSHTFTPMHVRGR